MYADDEDSSSEGLVENQDLKNPMKRLRKDDEDSSSEGLYEFDGFYTSDLVEQDERKKLLVENQDLNNQIKQLRNEMKRNEKKVI